MRSHPFHGSNSQFLLIKKTAFRPAFTPSHTTVSRALSMLWLLVHLVALDSKKDHFSDSSTWLWQPRVMVFKRIVFARLHRSKKIKSQGLHPLLSLDISHCAYCSDPWTLRLYLTWSKHSRNIGWSFASLERNAHKELLLPPEWTLGCWGEGGWILLTGMIECIPQHLFVG